MTNTSFNLQNRLPPTHGPAYARPTERLKAIRRRTLHTHADVLDAIRALKKSVIGMVWAETHDVDLFRVLERPDITEEYQIIPLPQILLDNAMTLYVITTKKNLRRTQERVMYRLNQESTIL